MSEHYDQREALYESGNWLKPSGWQPTAQRGPLSDLEISGLYFQVLGAQRLRPQDEALLSRLVRAVEQAHSIK